MKMARYEMIKEYLNMQSEGTLLGFWNEYASACDPDCTIYFMDEIDEILEGQSSQWLFDRMYYGDFRPTDEYFTFNGYGNLESFNKWNLEEHIFTSDLARYIDEEENDLGDVGLAEILEQA